MCITWKRCNGTGAVVGTITGFCCAITGWLVCTAKLNDGVINVATTFQDYPMLTGNLLSIGIGGIITISWSLISPANFDWEITRAINRKAEFPNTTIEETTTPDEGTPSTESKDKDEKNVNTPQVGEAEVNAFSSAMESRRLEEEKDMEGLKKAFRFAAISALALTFILIILIPLPLFFSSHGTYPTNTFLAETDKVVYPVQGFTACVVISIIWLFLGGFMVGIYPLWEARKGIWGVSLLDSTVTSVG
jgi:Na+/proline symporter